MKFFTNKKFLFKLIATLCICLTIFNFGAVPTAQAEGGVVSAAGGVLLDPICSLLLVLGDGVMEIIQKSIMGTSATAIFNNKDSAWLKILAIAIAVVLVVVVGVLTAGAGAVLLAAAKVAAVLLVAQIVTDGGVTAAVSLMDATFFEDNIVLPTYTIGPEEIFAGRVLLFDANIFNPKQVQVTSVTDEDGQTVNKYYYEEKDKNGNTVQIPTSINNAAYELKDTVAKWYYVIRNIAMIGLMLVLVYVGIRMLLSSIAAEKAKYKQMLGDWVIALCLVFFMHYIMVFANYFVEGVTDIFASLAENKAHIAVIQNPTDALVKGVKEVNEEYVKEGRIVWPTNLMGKMRVEAQEHDGTAEYVGYSICYIVLVMYTIFFAFTYAKRLLYLLFLTVIAPFVALTYPLDKIRDGQAQAFNTWIKEYIINLIIQPFHLLLYIIFVSMAFELAGTNIIYSLVVLGFMIPAEKFLRSMFGFNKANSPGFLAGPAGAALTISAVQSLAKFAGKGNGGKGAGGNGKGSGEQDKSKIRKADSNITTDNLTDDAVAIGNRTGEFLGSEEAERRSGSQEGSATTLDEGIPSESGNDNTTSENGSPRLIQPETEPPVVGEEDEESADGESYGEDSADSELPVTSPVTESSNNEKPSFWENKMDDLKYGFEQVPARFKSKGSDFIKSWKEAPGYMASRASLWKHNNLNKKKITGLAKTGLKKATTLGLGATGAAIGVAAGIASGSPGEAFKYGASAAYAGSAIGQGLVNRSSNMIDREQQRHDETLQKQLGASEYKRRKNEELDDEFMKDPEIRKKYQLRFNTKTRRDTDAILRDAIEYRKAGVSDDEVIMKAMSIDDPTQSASRIDRRNIAAAKLAMVSRSQKEFNDTMKRFKERKGVTQDHANDMAIRIKKINQSTIN